MMTHINVGTKVQVRVIPIMVGPEDYRITADHVQWTRSALTAGGPKNSFYLPFNDVEYMVILETT